MGKRKTEVKFRGFVVKGINRKTHKIEKLSPHFGSKDAAETTCELLKNNPEKRREYENFYVTEE